MEMIRCDKCGRVFSKYEYPWETVTTKECKVDLCKNCSDALNAWLRQKIEPNGDPIPPLIERKLEYTIYKNGIPIRE